MLEIGWERVNRFELGALMGAYFFEWLARHWSYAKFGAPLGTNASFEDVQNVQKTQRNPQRCGFFCVGSSASVQCRPIESSRLRRNIWGYRRKVRHDP